MLEKSDQYGWLSGSRRLDCDEIMQVRLEELCIDWLVIVLLWSFVWTTGRGHV